MARRRSHLERTIAFCEADLGALDLGVPVFQRIDDVDALFAEHVGTAISALVEDDIWVRLQTVFQQRHVLVHKQGIVDDEYVQRVPQTKQKAGQRAGKSSTGGPDPAARANWFVGGRR